MEKQELSLTDVTILIIEYVSKIGQEHKILPQRMITAMTSATASTIESFAEFYGVDVAKLYDVCIAKLTAVKEERQKGE